MMTWVNKWMEKFRPPVFLGCDIGSDYFKFVELHKEVNTLKVARFGLVQTGYAGNPSEATQAMRLYLKQKTPSIKRAAFNIEHDTLRIRRMDLAEMPARDMKIAIRWNFRDVVESEREQYVVSYTVLGEKTSTGKMPIVGYGISGKAVATLVEFVKKIGFKPATIEPNASALLSTFEFVHGFQGNAIYALMDIGVHSTNFVVVSGGQVLFSRPLTDIHLSALYKAVAREVAVDEVDGEKWLAAYVANKGGTWRGDLDKIELSAEQLDKISQSLGHFFSRYVVEVQRSLDAFSLMFKVDHVDGLYVSGGGALLPGLIEHLTTNIGVKSEILNPFSVLTPEDDAGALPVEMGPMFAVALGLALPR